MSIDDERGSFSEGATYGGLKRSTSYKWLERKQTPAYKLGRLWKFRKEEVDDWIRQSGAAENDEKTGKREKEDDQ